LKRTARRHDVIGIRITDVREQELPRIGLIDLEDAETGERLLLDTGSRAVRKAFAQAAKQRHEDLRQTTRAARMDLIEVGTEGNHLDALIRFYKMRERRYRRT